MSARQIALLLISVLALTSCTTTPVNPGASANREITFTNTVWQLQQLGGQDVAIDGAGSPRVIFLDDNRVSGFGGCNSFSGRYGTVGGQFRFLEMAATRDSCANTVVENRLFAAMKATRALELTEGRLQLMDSAGVTVARFQSAKK